MGDRSASMQYGRAAISLLESGSEELELVASGEQAVGACIVGFQCQRLFQQRDCLGCRLWHRNIRTWKSAQKEVVSVEIAGSFALDALNLRIAQTWLDCTHHAQRDFVLQRENVVELAVVALRPDMNAGFGLH